MFHFSSTQSQSAPADPVIPKATEGAGSTPESRSTEFKAVEGGPETMSGNTLMVEAYAVLWVILMGWIFFVWRKQAGLHSRLDELEKVLDQAAAQRAKR